MADRIADSLRPHGDLTPDRPVLREPGVLDTNGRGLRVVKELSLTYGCDQRDRWKVVWALLDGR